ncbi:hypothetical protein [Microbacterium enclense]|uniref:Sortase n=1 Tax=Microbacterium enclense TaxID=993073 RepID=A0A1G6GMV5_9MICO|nr:hypothetical protein [Microbacterium enclense]KSU56372.1 hypothetical protein AS029_01040 [Microbacterium enclense]SDB83301.1 hypothetical protein SAMN05216418_0447 [Microbacterium enclense]
MSRTPSLSRPVRVALATVAMLGTTALATTPAVAAVSSLVLQDSAGTTVTSGDATAYPSFASATLAEGCPSGAQDAARLSVTADTSVVVVSATISTDGASPVTVPMSSSFAEVVPAGVEAGGATLTLECLAVSGGIPVTVVPAATLPIAFSAGQWSISGTTMPTPTPTPTPTDASPAPTPSPTSSGPTSTPTAAASGAAATPSSSAAPAAGSASGLANTGVQVAGVVGIGLLALAAGTLITVVRARRRPAAQD